MTDEKEHSDTYAIVGELVLISSALDTALNEIVVAVLHLGDAPLLLPVVATLDPPRKIEMLRARASHIHAKSWKHPLLQFLDHVETVNKHRNLACHTPPVLEHGKWTLRPIAAAKLLKRLDFDAKELTPSAAMHDLKSAIALGEHALGEAVTILANFKRVAEEKARRDAAKATK